VNTPFARVLAVVRILIGVGFVWLGVSLFLNQNFLYGGLLERLMATGGPVRPYLRMYLIIERHETAVAYLSASASICAGLFFITGTLISWTSLGAAALVLNYALASSSGNWPHFLPLLAVALALLLVGRLGAGCTWGVDGWLIERVKDWMVLFPLRWRAPRAKVARRATRRVSPADK
jgi:uncharacterized membrane protein YphA (DoxX/SURF4 family)